MLPVHARLHTCAPAACACSPCIYACTHMLPHAHKLAHMCFQCTHGLCSHTGSHTPAPHAHTRVPGALVCSLCMHACTHVLLPLVYAPHAYMIAHACSWCAHVLPHAHTLAHACPRGPPVLPVCTCLHTRAHANSLPPPRPCHNWFKGPQCHAPIWGWRVPACPRVCPRVPPRTCPTSRPPAKNSLTRPRLACARACEGRARACTGGGRLRVPLPPGGGSAHACARAQPHCACMSTCRRGGTVCWCRELVHARV